MKREKYEILKVGITKEVLCQVVYDNEKTFLDFGDPHEPVPVKTSTPSFMKRFVISPNTFGIHDEITGIVYVAGEKETLLSFHIHPIKKGEGKCQ